MKVFTVVMVAIVLLVGILPVSGGESDLESSISESGQEAVEEEPNFGQDPTRPLWRLDLRQSAFGDSDVISFVTLVRGDAPVPLRDGAAGRVAFRIDVPVLAAANIDGMDSESGYGDLLFGATYIPPFPWTKERLGLDGVALGTEFVFPTSNVDAFSDNRWLVAAVFGFKLDTPRVSDGSFFVPQFKYRFKAGDHKEGAEDLRQFEVQPEFYFETRDLGWWLDFVSLWDTQEIEINFVDDGKRSEGDIFAPIEVTMGKMVGKHTVAALTLAVPIYASDSLDTYDWFVEARIGFLF